MQNNINPIVTSLLIKSNGHLVALTAQQVDYLKRKHLIRLDSEDGYRHYYRTYVSYGWPRPEHHDTAQYVEDYTLHLLKVGATN